MEEEDSNTYFSKVFFVSNRCERSNSFTSTIQGKNDHIDQFKRVEINETCFLLPDLISFGNYFRELTSLRKLDRTKHMTELMVTISD